MVKPSQEIWPRRPFERSLTLSDPEECYSSPRGRHISFDSDLSCSDSEQVECCRGCTDYYYSGQSTYCAKEEEEKKGATVDGSEEKGAVTMTSAEIVQTFKVVFFLLLPIFARQVGVFFSRRGTVQLPPCFLMIG
jgi:hypothetical protein